MWASRSMQSNMKQSRSNLYSTKDTAYEAPTRVLVSTASQIFGEPTLVDPQANRQTLPNSALSRDRASRASFSK